MCENVDMCGNVCTQVLSQRLRTSFGQPDSQVFLDEIIDKIVLKKQEQWGWDERTFSIESGEQKKSRGRSSYL